MRTFIASIVLLLAGCGGMHLEAPKNFAERIAYTEAGIKGALDTLDDLTCYQGYDKNGLCTQPGRPVSPAKAIESIHLMLDVQEAVKLSVTMPESGGLCLKETRTPEQCLNAAQDLLRGLELYLRDQVAK
jgi:hypothetical protein